jgi:hypothetical protein
MADRVRKVNYCYAKVSARAGQGAAVLGELRNAGVDLLAFSGFPIGGGKAQLDLVADDMAGVRRVAQRNGWRLSKTKKGFLVQGEDRLGACHRQLQKLADALAAGKGRYGMILWVKPKDYAKAARLLNAR